MKAIWILTTVYTPCWETKLDLWDSRAQGFYCAEEIWKLWFPVVTHPNSLMSQLSPPQPPTLTPPPLSWLLFIPTSCSDVLKKFLTPAIAFQHCSFRLLTGTFQAFPASLICCSLVQTLAYKIVACTSKWSQGCYKMSDVGCVFSAVLTLSVIRLSGINQQKWQT